MASSSTTETGALTEHELTAPNPFLGETATIVVERTPLQLLGEVPTQRPAQD
ncbi:hypothetical protein [Cellulomonas sp. HZM]|uniref:hypothetical protein n=1 Tax=Cellulomonas sp. HZM TaxID=1454010 RepID=UPI000A83DFAF|nr:hypothetical protein [Cellulomonas sp. HZM]